MTLRNTASPFYNTKITACLRQLQQLTLNQMKWVTCRNMCTKLYVNKQAYSLRNTYFIPKHTCVIHVTMIIYINNKCFCLNYITCTKGNYIIWAELGAEEVPEEKYVWLFKNYVQHIPAHKIQARYTTTRHTVNSIQAIQASSYGCCNKHSSVMYILIKYRSFPKIESNFLTLRTFGKFHCSFQ
jgi:hypothetical protein